MFYPLNYFWSTPKQILDHSAVAKYPRNATDVRTDNIAKTMIPTGRDFGLAEWINTDRDFGTAEWINILYLQFLLPVIHPPFLIEVYFQARG